MDISTIVGIVIGFALMIWGIGLGSIGNFVDKQSAIIVIGGTIAALIASYPFSILKQIPKHFKIMLDEKRFDPVEREGYQVTWTDSRKHITFTCPNGRRCRDSSLHDETFLKENLEALFVYRQMTDFHGEYSEPAIGWLGEVSQGLLQLGKQLEQDADLPPLPAPPVWTDSKLRRREAMKKLAQGQKLSHDSHSQGQGMMGY
ncbi:MAG: hypothetical protein HDT18_05020 [Oscillibacter sp.]|nr:hypothetical protein [Oscillibacter sp.]